MTEWLGIAGRMAFLIGGLAAVGSAGFLLLTFQANGEAAVVWRRRWFRLMGVLPVLAICGLLLQLLGQAMSLVGPELSTAIARETLEPLLQRTNFGKVWTLRSAAAFLLLALWAGVVFLRRELTRLPVGVFLVFALAAVAIGPWSGHSYGAESPALTMTVNALHILAAGFWAGALPCWVSWAQLNGQAQNPKGQSTAGLVVVRLFSRVALLGVAVLMLSGLLLADEFLEHTGDLLGTRYGLLIVFKLLLFAVALWLANHVRKDLATEHQKVRGRLSDFFFRTKPLVLAECGLALTVVMLAGALAQTTPAIHDQPVWHLPFRVSWEAARDAWPDALYGAFSLFLAGVALAMLVLQNHRGHTVTKARAVVLGVVALGGASAALYWLSVTAYPDTYRRSDVPYLAASVHQGQRLYQVHCVGCHGVAGYGDGALAGSLPVPPADLSEPHTALHTAGDMFWWFTHGIPESGMPGFANTLSEQDRWDLVNFLRAFSQGFEARVLRETIIPRDPWLGAPNFYFRGESGYSELKALRETHTVLLVFGRADHKQSRLRLLQLRHELSRQPVPGLKVLVVPIQADHSWHSLSPLQLVQSESSSIWATYSLLSRSLADRGDDNALGVHRSHVEFLIDRFGYVRARWVPGESDGWSDLDHLRTQVAALMREPEIEPPPDDHVH